MPGYVLYFAVFGACTFLALATFNALLRRERAEHLDAWFADGRPPGYGPPVPGSAATFSGTWLLTFRWVFRTPAWARADPQALRLLRRYRAAAIGSWIAWLAFAVKLLS